MSRRVGAGPRRDRPPRLASGGSCAPVDVPRVRQSPGVTERETLLLNRERSDPDSSDDCERQESREQGCSPPGIPQGLNATKKAREHANWKDDSLSEIRETEEHAQPEKGRATLP